jgi:hypothetical protein
LGKGSAFDLQVEGLLRSQGVPPEDLPDRYWVAQFTTATPSGRISVPEMGSRKSATSGVSTVKSLHTL